jgi:hypothetical protein
MLSETGVACVAIVFFKRAFKNCNKRIPQHIQQNCMTDFKLSEPKEVFFFIWAMHLAVSYSRLLTQHLLKYKYLRRNRSSQRLSITLLFGYRK